MKGPELVNMQCCSNDLHLSKLKFKEHPNGEWEITKVKGDIYSFASRLVNHEIILTLNELKELKINISTRYNITA